MLKTLVFMVGNNIALDRSIKKSIASVLSTIYDEKISLFAIEEQIDSAYSKLKGENLKQFFSEISAINTDREQTCFMYVVIMLLYMQLSDENVVLPVHTYNLALIKKFFAISRSELAQCYSALGEKLEKDTDDIADVFEKLTSAASIKEIESENPTLVYEEDKERLPAPSICDNPREEITKLYYQSMSESGSAGDDFKKHVCLAEQNPDFIKKVLNLYAKDCTGEDAILVFDNTFTRNCKNGLFLTNKNIYIGARGKLKEKIPLSDVKFIDVQASALINKVKINTAEIESEQLLKHGTIAFGNLLQKIIPLAMQIET